ncbi:phage-like protein [Caballeronia novacaledonica]|uniref:Phage-like protein n=1 Tax=Caballeronia novacaledonica TaxID=1544861 RepID=A0A2U3I7K2_9BURK|nr:HK97 family phage prohead protease [Caballeronia novacaledonica]SPB16091.1 phage-like protein [Caballeronia novacaledonica]
MNTKVQGPHDGYLREHPRNQNMRLEIKSADESTRQISGVASTGDIDRMNDVLDPAGGKWSTPIPLLHGHDYAQVIGNVTSMKRTARGIEFVARIAKLDTPENLRQRLDEIWALVRSKLLAHVSIGFRPLTWRPRDDGRGMLFTEFEVLELSIVPIPANGNARIESFSEAASYTPSAIDAEIDAVLARSRMPSNPRSYTAHVVRLDGKPAAKPDVVVRLTPADWQGVKQ